MKISRIMVVGAGQMGSGIAQVCAQAGFEVILKDVKNSYVSKGLGVIDQNLQRGVLKNRLTEEEKGQTLKRVKGTVDLQDGAAADLVIEAAVENLAVKEEIFKELDQICPAETILASNTSSLPITTIAAATARPDKVIGMHFMNPVPVMQLVEIIRGLATTDNTYRAIEELTLKLGKSPVEVNDFPGFVSNRILLPMINEAVYCLMEGVAAAEAIDQVMKLGMNHPMGPLALADLIGLDTCLSILEVLHEGIGDPKYRPCPLLKKYVAAGWLGRKTGRGIYEYNPA